MFGGVDYDDGMDPVQLDYISANTVIPPRKRRFIFFSFVSLLCLSIVLLVMCFSMEVIWGEPTPGVGMGTQLLVNLFILALFAASGFTALRASDPQQFRLKDAAICPARSRFAAFSLWLAVFSTGEALLFSPGERWMLKSVYLHGLGQHEQTFVRVFFFTAFLFPFSAFVLGSLDIVLAYLRPQPLRGYRWSILAVCLALNWLFLVAILEIRSNVIVGRQQQVRQRDIDMSLLFYRDCEAYENRYGFCPRTLDVFVTGDSVPTEYKAGPLDLPLPSTHDEWVAKVMEFAYMENDMNLNSSTRAHDLIAIVHRTVTAEVPVLETDAAGKTVYAHEGYVTVFADGHGEVIHPKDWAAKWEAHNAARSALELPAEADPLKR